MNRKNLMLAVVITLGLYISCFLLRTPRGPDCNGPEMLPLGVSYYTTLDFPQAEDADWNAILETFHDHEFRSGAKRPVQLTNDEELEAFNTIMAQLGVETLQPYTFDDKYLWVVGHMKILRLLSEETAKETFCVKPYFDLDLGVEGVLSGSVGSGFVVYETDKVKLLYE